MYIVENDKRVFTFCYNGLYNTLPFNIDIKYNGSVSTKSQCIQTYRHPHSPSGEMLNI